MKLSEFCISRPVFTIVLNLLIILIGGLGFYKLSVRQYPNIDPPIVTVETYYRGANAEVIETEITKRLEESISGIAGIDYMTSISRAEQSQITVFFKLKYNPEEVANEVRDRVSRTQNQLPTEADTPLIQKVEADAQPIIYLAFSSDRHTPIQVTDFAERFAKDALQTLDGVAEIMLFGARRESIKLALNANQLASFHLEPRDIEQSVQQQNLELATGRIESINQEFTLRAQSTLNSVPEFNQMIIKQTPNYLVRFQDIGQAQLEAENIRIDARFNGEPAIALGVVKQSTANPIDISRAVRQAIPKIQATLPAGVTLAVAHDQSVFIEASIQNVYQTLFESIVLVILIISVFLKSARAVLIPLTTIPISLIGSFAIMFFLGFTINLLTLLALVLAIGLVVDDAIVMLENCYRYVEEKVDPPEAARIGANEIGFAIIAMTLTLAAVYFPVGFISGATGKLFTEFSWVLAGSVLISGFISLTLSPMLCAYLLKSPRDDESVFWVFQVFDTLWSVVTRGYLWVLDFALHAKYLVLFVLFLILIANLVVFKQLKSELAPLEDEGTLITFFMAPEGSTLHYTQKYAREIEKLYDQIPEKKLYFSISGYPVISQGVSFLKLKPWSERTRMQQMISFELLGKVLQIPGVMAFTTNPPPFGQGFQNKPVSIVLLSNRSYSELDALSQKILARARQSKMFNSLDNDLKLNNPEIQIIFDRDKIANLNLSVAQIGQALEIFFGGREAGEYTQKNEKYKIIVQGQASQRQTPADLTLLHVRTPNQVMVPLSNLIRFEETSAPRELNHFNQLRSITLSSQLNPGYTLSEGLAELESIIREIAPPDTQIDYTGQSREFLSTSVAIYSLFGLAIVFIYLVLAAQFESFIDPLIILFTVPFAILGSLLSLWLLYGTLNIYSQVGMITLIGLITKHGILIVEFANQAYLKNKNRMLAIQSACAIRLRPILMTTFAMIFGVLPLILTPGAGFESRYQIGLVIVGGMAVGTLFTLIILPVIYIFMKKQDPINSNTEKFDSPGILPPALTQGSYPS